MSGVEVRHPHKIMFSEGAANGFDSRATCTKLFHTSPDKSLRVRSTCPLAEEGECQAAGFFRLHFLCRGSLLLFLVTARRLQVLLVFTARQSVACPHCPLVTWLRFPGAHVDFSVIYYLLPALIVRIGTTTTGPSLGAGRGWGI